MSKFYISNALREAVILRASNCCEYCKSQDKYSPTSFTIDHIIPESLDGATLFENLAYACFLCNRLKSNKIKTFDELTEKWVSLFRACSDFGSEAKESKFYFRRGKICSRMWAIRRKF